MERQFGAVLERQTVLGKLIDRVNYRPLRQVYTTMNGLLSIIDHFLSSEEGNLSSLRTKLLNSFSLLARTFYQSSLIGHLRSSSEAAKEFQSEVNRAFIKGLNERENIINQIETIIQNGYNALEQKEELNGTWQELYYFLSSESKNKTNLRNSLTLVKSFFDKYMERFPEASKEFSISHENIDQITELSIKAITIGDKAQVTLHELLDLSINPLCAIFEDEIKTAEKILSQIQSDVAEHSENKLSDDEIGKLCDVLSWGLDDVNSWDDLIKIGKELRNDYANLLAEFLVFLVDIDLGIQEIEAMAIESVKR